MSDISQDFINQLKNVQLSSSQATELWKKINSAINCGLTSKKGSEINQAINVVGYILPTKTKNLKITQESSTWITNVIFGENSYLSKIVNNSNIDIVIVLVDRTKILSDSAFYNALRFFIGKDFDNIIKFQSVVDEDGHQISEDLKDKPYFGIGLIKFREQFDEIMEYYYKKNKKQDSYNDIMKNKEKVFTQSIPVFTVLLRPVDIDVHICSHETTNQYYIMINRFVTELNKISNNTSRRAKRYNEPEIKSIQDLLWKLQMKVEVLYGEIINIIKGKKGNIRTLFGGRYNFTSRDVVIADPSLRIDQIRLPYACLLEWLQPRIINILTKTYNLSYSDAYDRWYHANLKKDKTIIRIIESIIYNSTPEHYGLPVIINRNP